MGLINWDQIKCAFAFLSVDTMLDADACFGIVWSSAEVLFVIIHQSLHRQALFVSFVNSDFRPPPVKQLLYANFVFTCSASFTPWNEALCSFLLAFSLLMLCLSFLFLPLFCVSESKYNSRWHEQMSLAVGSQVCHDVHLCRRLLCKFVSLFVALFYACTPVLHCLPTFPAP